MMTRTKVLSYNVKLVAYSHLMRSTTYGTYYFWYNVFFDESDNFIISGIQKPYYPAISTNCLQETNISNQEYNLTGEKILLGR